MSNGLQQIASDQPFAFLQPIDPLRLRPVAINFCTNRSPNKIRIIPYQRPVLSMLSANAENPAQRNKLFWLLPHDQSAVTTALEANISHFLFTDSQLFEKCSSVARFSATCLDQSNTFPGGVYVPLQCADDVKDLMHVAGRHDVVIIDPQDWKQIPVENLIAAFQQSSTKLITVVDSVDDAKTMFTSLQRGVDGCVLRTTDLSQIASFAALMRSANHDEGQLGSPFQPAKITRIHPVGVGQRVCVDTCSLIAENEGMLVGSSSQALYLVLSEAALVHYAPSRPFRVNAGPVHSYCLVPGGKTRYLSELAAGDTVLLANNHSTSYRTAIVGRCKIETRPLLMFETLLTAENGHLLYHNLFVQNAETVRLGVLNEENEPGMKSVSELKIGDRLMLKPDTAARHIGLPIDEYLVEK